MKAFWRGKKLATVFGSAGLDENSATAALGRTLAQSPTLARALLEDLFGETVDASDLQVDMQRHEPEDGGFTYIDAHHRHVRISALGAVPMRDA